MMKAIRFYSRKNLFLCVISLISLCSGAQVLFEPGYIVDTTGLRTECLIKNIDWENNPKEIEYKVLNSETINNGSIINIKEFGIYGYSKFLKTELKIDRSSVNLSKPSKISEPEWSKETVFLRQLLGGKACLYVYREENAMTRYFYSTPMKPINQLVYKKFTANEGQIYENSSFRIQLWVDVRCEKMSKQEVERLRYNEKELTSYFKKYNTCQGDTVIEYAGKYKKQREVFNLKISPGISFQAVTFSCATSTGKFPQSVDLDNKISPRLGIEAEFILPINKNKWSLFAEPYYKSYSGSKMIEGYDTVKINFKSIELSLGLRYYMYLNSEFKVFLNIIGNPGLAMNFNSNIEYNWYYKPLEITNSMSFAYGAGLEYKRISLEFRNYSKKNILNGTAYYSCYYKEFAFIVGYKFLKYKS